MNKKISNPALSMIYQAISTKDGIKFGIVGMIILNLDSIFQELLPNDDLYQKLLTVGILGLVLLFLVATDKFNIPSILKNKVSSPIEAEDKKVNNVTPRPARKLKLNTVLNVRSKKN